MQLQPVTEDDKTFVESLIRTNLEDYYHKYSLSWSHRLFDEDWHRTRYSLILDQGVRVGVVGLRIEPECLYLRDLHLRSSYRQKGLGSAAVAALLAPFRHGTRRSARLKLFQCNPARSLFERLGFEVVRVDPPYLCMEMPLSPESATASKKNTA